MSYSLSPLDLSSCSAPLRSVLDSREIDQAWVFDIPLKVRFRSVTSRNGMVFHGPQGWGEFAPFPEYGAQESSNWLNSALDAASRPPAVPLRDRVPVNAIIPVVTPDEAAHMAERAGSRTAKIKVADPRVSLEEDRDRVGAVAQVLRSRYGAEARIRVDANGAWSVDQAEEALSVLDEAAQGLEYVEQPCATVDELAQLRRRVGVPIAADESIRRAEDPMMVAQAEAADLIVIKVAPLGGVERALALSAKVGLPVVVSSAVDTSLGLSLGVELAAALPTLDFACGFGTGALMTSDITASLDTAGGFIDVAQAQRLRTTAVLKEIGRAPVDSWRRRLESVAQCL